MTPATEDLRALLARVEVAEGPRRELDGAIHRALFAAERVMVDGGDVRTRRPAAYGTVADLAQIADRDVADVLGVPAYTASLDAALALVERVLPGCGYLVEREPVAKGGDSARASLTGWIGREGAEGRAWVGHSENDAPGATPALALLAALLKALIAQAETAETAPA